ncbi:MAG TPA: PilC/PilY family type IV pilus protein [Burkholderiales bacterium]|nr:PilC/PilY family type IV pilus protein [Burkholderiales bacterium]
MKLKDAVLIQRLLACAVAANFAAQPAFAQVTISQQPLSATGGAAVLPNVLFTLDASGSMDSDFVPDYVAGNAQCMNDNSGGTQCSAGDPPYSAGGQFGSNGVAYDPNFSYIVGVDSNGQPHTNAPTGTWPDPTTNKVPNDAYGAQSGSTTNISNNITDRNYCNDNNVCKRNGQLDASGGALVTGPNDLGVTMSAGTFPYRTNRSNKSTVDGFGNAAVVFGLPEMMQLGSGTRANTTVTVTTTEAHGISTGDKVWVTSNNAGITVTCATVTNSSTGAVTPGSPLITSSFQYATASGSGTLTSRTVSFRKCVDLPGASFSRTSGSNVVTVTSTAHGLTDKDLINVANTGVTTMNALTTPVTITWISADKFSYQSSCSGGGGSSCTTQSTAGSWVRTGLYNDTGNVTAQAPAAYRIVPLEYCADANLTDCILATTPGTPPSGTFNNKTYNKPAYVRFCKTQEDALAHGAVNGQSGSPTATNRCQGKFISGIAGIQSYTFGRYGLFVRDTIRSAGDPFTGGRSGRVDCAATGCTYAQELQNYATWFAYYKTRMQMMKSSVGISLRGFVSNPSGTPPKPDNMRLGFITINPFYPNGGSSLQSSIQTANYLRIDNFNLTNAGNFYTKFYAQKPANSTPLREALSRAGWIFAGKLNQGLTTGIPAGDDPIQSSCQKNFSLLTTDGFWNGNGGQDIAGVAMGNIDNQDPRNVTGYSTPFASRAQGTYDGAIAGASGTLADVALYYYMTDLRGGKDLNGKTTGPATSPNAPAGNTDVSANNVLTNPKDFAFHQHMTTYTVGLADGLMLYDPSYESATAGDFANIKAATPGACFWASGVCNWPAPVADQQSALDDLWHSAVNGRGTYFLALNPRTLSNALSSAFQDFSKATHAASAAATSSPNITATDNFAFTTTYQTNTWSGILQALALKPDTGEIDTSKGILWSADTVLYNQMTSGTGRVLWMSDPTQTTKLKPFAFAGMTAAEQAFFTGHCTTAPTLSQCTVLLSAAQKAQVNAGSALVDFLGGVVSNEGVLFRDRTETDPITGVTTQTILGDIVDAEPAFVRLPPFKYTDTGYSSFSSAQQGRAGALYVAANDGYLHAFDSLKGSENWAYMPKFVMPGVYQLADMQYAGAHSFFLDATPETNDVFDVNTSTWKTVIVGGAAAGARGYYALDITDPQKPQGLWEFCWDSNLCPKSPDGVVHSDTDLGFTYGNPVFGKIPATSSAKSIAGNPIAGKWVVVLTSGLNNTGLPVNAPIGTPTGSGGGFFFVLDVITGEVLAKIPTLDPATGLNVGTIAKPSGLLKHAGFYKSGLTDATISFMYGGDQQGNVWRIDMSADPLKAAHMVTLKDKAGNPQPITVRPVATNINNGATRLFYVGTGRYIAQSDTTDTSQQTIYGLKDQDTDYGTDVRAIGLVEQVLSSGATSDRSITNNTVNWSTQNGFFIDLNPGNTSPGERIIIDPRLELGTLIFASNVPVVGGCSAGGTSFVYNLDFQSGSYVPGTANGIAGTYLNAFLVGVTPIQTTTGDIKTVNTDSTGKVGTGNVNINKNAKGISRFMFRER